VNRATRRGPADIWNSTENLLRGHYASSGEIAARASIRSLSCRVRIFPH
jgi:hypothetical protein